MLAFYLQLPLDWPLAPTILVVLGGLFLLAYCFGPRYGLIAQWRRARN
jgi:ABC-type Mn2+/Zn2+ transport system permease subunit